MGKTSRKKKQQHVSREEANAADGQIVRIGEKEKCSACKNWVRFGFTLRLGTPPHRAQCGPNAKCDGGCGLNLCHNCVDQEECRTTWFLCPHNKTGTSAGAKNDCVSKNPVKFCSDCTDVESRARKLYLESDDDKGVSDMEHQKNHALIYCGGFDRGSCMAAGSVRRTVKECRECALSGERMMRICYCCGKIRCISCIGLARDQGGDMMGQTNSGWNILAEMGLGDDEGMGDMMKAQFINDFIKRCGDCGRDVCMECTSEETLASNMSKARLFDCKESGCRCVGCMTKERMASKIDDDTSFKCDECRQAKLKCHNPGCNNRYKFFCTRCGKANYCSRECQVAAWSSHKPDCHKKKNSSKQKEEKKKKKATSSRGAKLNRNEAKEMIGDLKNAHASYGRE